jgi:hypothetical protein
MGLHQKSYLMNCNSKEIGASYRPFGNLYVETKKEARLFIYDLLIEILN